LAAITETFEKEASMGAQGGESGGLSKVRNGIHHAHQRVTGMGIGIGIGIGMNRRENEEYIQYARDEERQS